MRIIPKSGFWSVGLAVALAACAPARTSNQAVTTLYPVEFLAQSLSGGMPPVRNLAAAGVEPHDLELSSRQVDAIEDARLVFVLSSGFQPAVDAAIARRNGTTIDLTKDLPGDAPAAARDDPHVWLDPVLMRAMAQTMSDAFIAAQPDRMADYRTRFSALDAQLVALDAEYRDGLADCRRRTFFTAHAAFGWLASRYGLTQVSLAGRDPEVEPSAARIAEVADRAKREGATTVFIEELVPPKPAETLAREAGGLAIATLSPIESRTPEQVEAGADYISLMRANLEALRTALGCT